MAGHTNAAKTTRVVTLTHHKLTTSLYVISDQSLLCFFLHIEGPSLPKIQPAKGMHHFFNNPRLGLFKKIYRSLQNNSHHIKSII